MRYHSDPEQPLSLSIQSLLEREFQHLVEGGYSATLCIPLRARPDMEHPCVDVDLTEAQLLELRREIDRILDQFGRSKLFLREIKAMTREIWDEPAA